MNNEQPIASSWPLIKGVSTCVNRIVVEGMSLVVNTDTSISSFEWRTGCEPQVVRVTGEIDSDCIDDFDAAVEAALASPLSVIPVVIQSGGGDIYAAFHMVATLKRAAMYKPVATCVQGGAASAAAVLFCAGSMGHRYMAPDAMLMVHEVRVEEMAGKMAGMRSETSEMERLNETMFNIIESASTKPHEFFTSGVRRTEDLYIDAPTALEWGIANVIGCPVFTLDVTPVTRTEVTFKESSSVNSKGKRLKRKRNNQL